MDPAKSLNIKLGPTKVSKMSKDRTNLRPYHLHYTISTQIRSVKNISCFRILKKYIANSLCSDLNGKFRSK